MAKKIDVKTIKEIIRSFDTDKTDAEISEEFKVSVSYVNKLRSKSKQKEEPEEEQRFVVVVDDRELEEIEVLQLKINSLEQTLKWYKELIDFKKSKKK